MGLRYIIRTYVCVCVGSICTRPILCSCAPTGKYTCVRIGIDQVRTRSLTSRGKLRVRASVRAVQLFQQRFIILISALGLPRAIVVSGNLSTRADVFDAPMSIHKISLQNPNAYIAPSAKSISSGGCTRVRPRYTLKGRHQMYMRNAPFYFVFKAFYEEITHRWSRCRRKPGVIRTHGQKPPGTR